MDIFNVENALAEDKSADSILLMGVTHTGKSTSFGTLSGKNILYIVTPEEAHGPKNAKKMNDALVAAKKAKASMFVVINLGIVQDLDVKLGIIPEAQIKSGNIKVGDEFPKEYQLDKLEAYLEKAPDIPKIDVVILEGLSSLHEVILRSSWIHENCPRDSKGALNSFNVPQFIKTKYSQIAGKLSYLGERGIMNITTVLVKYTEFAETEQGILPTNFVVDLPTVPVATALRSYFESTALMYRHKSVANNTPYLEFKLNGGKTSRSWTTGDIKHHWDADLRLKGLPLHHSLDKLPADWENLNENIKKYAIPPEPKKKS